jgi:hypothetical protein
VKIAKAEAKLERIALKRTALWHGQAMLRRALARWERTTKLKAEHTRALWRGVEQLVVNQFYRRLFLTLWQWRAGADASFLQRVAMVQLRGSGRMYRLRALFQRWQKVHDEQESEATLLALDNMMMRCDHLTRAHCDAALVHAATAIHVSPAKQTRIHILSSLEETVHSLSALSTQQSSRARSRR